MKKKLWGVFMAGMLTTALAVSVSTGIKSSAATTVPSNELTGEEDISYSGSTLKLNGNSAIIVGVEKPDDSTYKYCFVYKDLDEDGILDDEELDTIYKDSSDNSYIRSDNLNIYGLYDQLSHKSMRITIEGGSYSSFYAMYRGAITLDENCGSDVVPLSIDIKDDASFSYDVYGLASNSYISSDSYIDVALVANISDTTINRYCSIVDASELLIGNIQANITNTIVKNWGYLLTSSKTNGEVSVNMSDNTTSNFYVANNSTITNNLDANVTTGTNNNEFSILNNSTLNGDCNVDFGDEDSETTFTCKGVMYGCNKSSIGGNYTLNAQNVADDRAFYLICSTSSVDGTFTADIEKTKASSVCMNNSTITGKTDIKLMDSTIGEITTDLGSGCTFMEDVSLTYDKLTSGSSLSGFYNIDAKKNVTVTMTNLALTGGMERGAIGKSKIAGNAKVSINSVQSDNYKAIYGSDSNNITGTLDVEMIDVTKSGSGVVTGERASNIDGVTNVYLENVNASSTISALENSTCNDEIICIEKDSESTDNIVRAIYGVKCKKSADISVTNCKTKTTMDWVNGCNINKDCKIKLTDNTFANNTCPVCNSVICGNLYVNSKNCKEIVNDTKQPSCLQYGIYATTVEGNVNMVYDGSYAGEILPFDKSNNSNTVCGNAKLTITNSYAGNVYIARGTTNIFGDLTADLKNVQITNTFTPTNYAHVGGDLTVNVSGGYINSQIVAYESNEQSIYPSNINITYDGVTIGKTGENFYNYYYTYYDTKGYCEFKNCIFNIEKDKITNYISANDNSIAIYRADNDYIIAGKYIASNITADSITFASNRAIIIPEGVTVTTPKFYSDSKTPVLLQGQIDGAITGRFYLLNDGGSCTEDITDTRVVQYYPLDVIVKNEELEVADLTGFNLNYCYHDENSIPGRYFIQKGMNSGITVTPNVGYVFKDVNGLKYSYGETEVLPSTFADNKLAISHNNPAEPVKLEIEFAKAKCTLTKTVKDPVAKVNTSTSFTDPLYDLATVEITGDSKTGTVSYALAEGATLPAGLKFKDGRIYGLPTELNEEGTDVDFDITCKNGNVSTLTLKIKVTADGSSSDYTDEYGIEVNTTSRYIDLKGIPVVIEANEINELGEVTSTAIYLDKNRDGTRDSNTPLTAGNYSNYSVYGVYNKSINTPINITMKSGLIYHLYGAYDSQVTYKHSDRDAVNVSIEGGKISYSCYLSQYSTVIGNCTFYHNMIDSTIGRYYGIEGSASNVDGGMLIEDTLKDDATFRKVQFTNNYVLKRDMTFDDVDFTNGNITIPSGITLTITGTAINDYGTCTFNVDGKIICKNMGLELYSGTKIFYINEGGTVECETLNDRYTTIYLKGTLKANEYTASDRGGRIYMLGGSFDKALDQNKNIYYPISYTTNLDGTSYAGYSYTADITVDDKKVIVGRAGYNVSIYGTKLNGVSVEAQATSGEQDIATTASIGSSVTISFTMPNAPVDVDINYVYDNFSIDKTSDNVTIVKDEAFTEAKPIYDLTNINIYGDVRPGYGTNVEYTIDKVTKDNEDCNLESVSISKGKLIGTIEDPGQYEISIIIKGRSDKTATFTLNIEVKAEHTHAYDEFYYDETGHGYRCECGASDSFEAHTLITTNTDDGHRQECSVCEYKTAYAAHSLVMKHDDAGHHYECIGCKYKGTVYEHNYPDEFVSDGSVGHIHICTACSHKSAAVAHKLVRNHNNDRCWYECTDCEYTEQYFYHSMKQKYDNEKHWMACQRAECTFIKDEEAHSLDEGVVTLAATETTTGIKLFSCSGCEYTYEETIPMLVPDHEHEYEAMYRYDENKHWRQCGCGEKIAEGQHEFVVKYDKTKHWTECETCGYIPEDSEVEHNLSYHINSENENCHYQSCDGCDYKTKDYSHSYEWIINDDTHSRKCNICEYTTVEEAHKYDKGVVVKSATETEEGRRKYTCSTCNKIKLVAIPMIGADHVHSYLSGYHYDANNHWMECDNCGEKTEEAAHTGGTATCKEKAVCSVCENEYGDFAQHSYSEEWLSDATGHWHECGICNDKKDEEAHVDENNDYICDTCSYVLHTHSGTKVDGLEPTCKAYGYNDYYECACGKYYTDEACTNEITDLDAWKLGDGKIDMIDHTGGKATCKAKAVCEVCGEEYGDLANHSYATKWTTDGTKHWHECSECGDKKDIEAHSGGKATCSKKAVCTKCGKAYGTLASHKLVTTTTKATPDVDGKIETKCSICKKVTKTEIIYAVSDIQPAKDKYAFTGKEQKPAVIVKDSKGNTIATSNYDIKYPTGMKKVGTYTITITLNGDKYTGTKNISYVINPAKTKIKSVKPASKSLIVNWIKKNKEVTGYEIQYSTDKNFKKGTKKVTIKSAKKTNTTIKKLKPGKKYYVRIRTYKKIGSKKYYSDWSAKKAVKVKK